MKTTTLLPKMVNLLLLFFLIITVYGYGQLTVHEDTEQVLQSVRDSFPGVPGAHVVVVDADGILFRASSGYAEVESQTEFTPETGMYIASNTKAFVGLAMAQLIEKGRIGLDDPITRYIDRDHFPDSIDVSNILISDLPGHTHGLTNDAMTFRTAFAGNAPDSLLPELLRYTSYYFHPPAKKFRYNNFSYLMCGMVIEKVTGQSWREYLRDSLLIPAGLENTTPYYSEYANRPVVGSYLFDRPGKELGFTKHDNTMHAAGGLISTDEDMARWLRLFINDGHLDGREVLSSENIRRAKTTLVADTGIMGPFERFGYTYGWLTGKFNGENIYFHFGNYTGLGCMMSFLPERKLGVFAFVNEGVGGLFLSALISTWVYNRILEKENTEQINARVMDYVKGTYANSITEERSPVSLENMSFTGPKTVSNEIYGNISLYPENEKMMTRFGNMLSPVYQGDSARYYKVEWVPGDVEWIKLYKTKSGIELLYEDYGVFKEN